MDPNQERETLQVGADEASAALDTLLADPAFRATPRQREFLRYIGKEFLEGRGDAIKAYTLGVDVFGRTQSFDPTNDPIVRIEATRLRATLTQYYKTAGQHHPVRIDLPRGRYVPAFTRVSGGMPVSGEVASVAAAARESFHLPIWAALLAGLLAVAGLSALFLFPAKTGAEISGRPIVTLELTPADPADGEREQFRQRLTEALSLFATLQVAEPGATAATEQAKSNRYRIVLNYRRLQAGRDVQWSIVSSAGELLQGGQLSATDAGPSLDTLVGRLSARLAGYRGAIPSIETRWQLDHPSLGAGCVQRAVFVMLERRTAELDDVRSCVDATILLQPGNADARAALTYILLTRQPFETPEADLQQALDSARMAVSLAPESPRAAASLLLALYHDGQVEAAIEEARRAVALNPNEPAVEAYLGWLLFATGNWDEGVRRAKAAIETDPLAYFDSGTTLVLDLYRRGDFEGALARVAERPQGKPYLVMLTCIAAFAELGRLDEAAAVEKELRAVRPSFDKTFRADMAARSITPELSGRLAASLRKAGLAIPEEGA